MCNYCYKNSEFFDMYVAGQVLKWRLNGPTFEDVYWELNYPEENGTFDYKNIHHIFDEQNLVLLPACPSIILSYVTTPGDWLDWR